MGLEVGDRAAIERLSGTPQGFLTATRGGEEKRERRWQESSLSHTHTHKEEQENGELSSLSRQAKLQSIHVCTGLQSGPHRTLTVRSVTADAALERWKIRAVNILHSSSLIATRWSYSLSPDWGGILATSYWKLSSGRAKWAVCQRTGGEKGFIPAERRTDLRLHHSCVGDQRRVRVKLWAPVLSQSERLSWQVGGP